MTFLVLVVVCSTVNHLLFKALSRFRIDLLSVIVVNYAVCMIIGYSASIESAFHFSVFSRSWFPISMIQGALFFACFFLMGRTTEKHGVSAATIATRLSVAIPTIAAFMLYGDKASVGKLIGMLTAVLALYLSGPEPANSSHSPKSLPLISILPFALFVAFGLHSTLIKFVQERFLDGASYHVYVMAAFFSAFLVSGSFLAWRLLKKRQRFRWRELAWGLALGCANYGAIYFLIRTLSVAGWYSSRLFPTISIAVIISCAASARAFFNERPSRRMLGALAIGVGSIILINV